MRTQAAKRRFTIGKKLALGVTASMVCLAVLSVTSLGVISTLGQSLDTAVNNTARKLDLVGGTQQAFEDLKSASVRVQIVYAIAFLQKNTSVEDQICSSCHTPASVESSVRDIQASGAAVRQRSAELRKLVSDDNSRAALDTLDEGAARWVEYSAEYLRLAQSDKFYDAHVVLKDRIFPIAGEAAKASQSLAQTERAALSESNDAAQGIITRGRWAIFTVIGLNIVVAFVVLLVVYRITNALRRVAVETGNGADEVARAALQLSGASRSLASGAGEQASSLEETSASAEQIYAVAGKNSESLQVAAELVTQSQQKFVQTERALHEMVAAMAEINLQSDRISKIIRVIDEIAFQTNILSLNASVEAARAGKAGVGFAVVADAVRSLALRSAKAAQDTAALIEESIVKSHDGQVKVDQVAAAIRAVTAQTEHVKALVDQVSSGSGEQARGIEQIGNSLVRIEQVTQTAVLNSRETAMAAEELTGHSETMRGIVERLTSMVGGG